MTNNRYDRRDERDDRRDPRDDRGRGDPREDRGGRGGRDEGPTAEEVAALIPAGRHRGRRLELDYGWTSGQGDSQRKEQIGVLFEFLDLKPAGRTLTWYGYFTDKTLESTFKAMRSLGWEGNDPMKGWPDPATAPEVDLVVNHERNLDGDWIARIRWVNSGGVAMKESMSDADRANFSKRMSGIAARLAAGDDSGPRDDRSLPDQRRGRDEEPPPPSDDDAPPFQRGRNGQSQRR